VPKLTPAWGDLRGDPRFAEIIAAVSVPVKGRLMLR
jgi:hypothetical protein